MSVATRASSFFAASTVPCGRSRIRELVYVRLSCVGFKINLSSFYSSASKSSSIHKSTKIEGTMERSSQTGKTTKKESSMESHVSIDLIRSDPSKLEVMTVEELRKLTRSVGIPARGRKKDLMSSLRAFSMKMENASVTSSLTVSQDRHAQVMASGNAKLSAKRKFEPSTSGDDPEFLASVPEVSQNTQKRSRRRKQLVESTSVQGETGARITKQELSVETEHQAGVSDAKQSSVSKKASSNIKSSTLGIDDTCLSVNASEPWTVLAHKKPQDGWVPYNPRTMRPLPLTRDTMFMKVVSWNVNGLKALLKSKSFSALQLAQKEDFDVLCLQETKLQEKNVEDIRECLIKGYNHGFWTCSVSKLGYSGTAIVSRIKPISVRYGLGLPDHDSEGRLVTVEFERYYLISGYVPNSGDGLRRLEYRIKEWDPALSNYMKDLEKSKPVILTGDLNCAHEEIDIYNPAGNRRSAGFTDEERKSLEVNFLSRGFVDTFRKQHPGVVGYTYWGYRHGGRKTNKGWRLDYFLVSEAIADNVHDSYILPEVIGSDHCPIGLILKH